jgi:hypothetical protein
MIQKENKNTIHFKQRLLPNCLPDVFENVTVNGGENTSQYNIPHVNSYHDSDGKQEHDPLQAKATAKLFAARP